MSSSKAAPPANPDITASDSKISLNDASTPTLDPRRPKHASTLAAFDPPTPSMWKRISLVLFIVGCFWFANWLRTPVQQSKIIYASRYSDEHRFRPAASPVITEHLPDGRIRLRGASPAGVGIQEGDLPKTAKELEKERKEKKEEALEKAKKQLGLKMRKGKGKKGKKGGRVLVDERGRDEL